MINHPEMNCSMSISPYFHWYICNLYTHINNSKYTIYIHRTRPTKLQTIYATAWKFTKDIIWEIVIMGLAGQSIHASTVYCNYCTPLWMRQPDTRYKYTVGITPLYETNYTYSTVEHLCKKTALKGIRILHLNTSTS